MLSFLNQVWHKLAWSAWSSRLLLFAFFWMVAAAGFSGSVGKWGLRDNAAEFSIEGMLEARAQKPFVYRQLLPMLANAADRAAPPGIKQLASRTLGPQKVYVKASSAANPAISFRYIVVYYLSFLSLLGSLFLMRAISLDAGLAPMTAVLAPSALALAFPYLQTVGGFFYDSAELFFFALAFLLVSRRQTALFFAILIPATLNKESFLFFVVALLPLLMHHYPKRSAAAIGAAAVLVSGLVNAAVKLMFADAPGGAVQYHLAGNLQAYLSGAPYSQLELTYGLAGPRQAFALTLFIIALVFARGWRDSPGVVKRHILLAAAINLPLFAAFAAAGELRNLSLLFIGFAILIGKALEAGGRAETPEASIPLNLEQPRYRHGGEL
ncbi:hypothetical protein LJR289_002427 [Pseudoduganella sp. LjRoot289]|uniref:hypothetical protein n=1 Tax=Pseudoduganella sp. LjRoot289 TaxID=3342314 RepID=UPI003ECD9191